LEKLDEKIVGILHDVIEDCPEYSYDFLRKKGFLRSKFLL
jgi:hypothetical protein